MGFKETTGIYGPDISREEEKNWLVDIFTMKRVLSTVEQHSIQLPSRAIHLRRTNSSCNHFNPVTLV